MSAKTHLGGDAAPAGIGSHRQEQQVARLIDRLPARLQTIARWLRRPSSRWIRMPTGALLIIGALLSVLPFFGPWMLPLGLILLAEEFPPLRRARDRMLQWIERCRPQWFGPPQMPARRGRSASSATAGDVVEDRPTKRTWVRVAGRQRVER